VVWQADADVSARGGRTHRGEAGLEDLRPALGAGGLAHAGKDPVRHCALRLRAPTKGDVVAGATDPARKSAALRPPYAGARHRGRVRPAPQDAAAKLEAARPRSHSAAGKSGPRPDRARGGYCSTRLRRARKRIVMTRM